jgi:hypothetical protein
MVQTQNKRKRKSIKKTHHHTKGKSQRTLKNNKNKRFFRRTGGKRQYTSKIRGGDRIDRNFLEKFKKLVATFTNPLPNKYLECLGNASQSMGKSAQLVRLCGDEVLKQQQLATDKRQLIKEKKGENYIYKLDSFTMMVLQQNIMKSIYKTYGINNIEHPKDIYTNITEKGGGETITFLFDKANNNPPVLEQYIYYETRKEGGLDVIYDDIADILISVFNVNDLLYDICQFQHCDMKCAQILLKLNNATPRKIVPIFSDFDKSTCSIQNYDPNLATCRLRLAKNDTAHSIRPNINLNIMGKKQQKPTIDFSAMSGQKKASNFVDYNNSRARATSLTSMITFTNNNTIECNPNDTIIKKIKVLEICGILDIDPKELSGGEGNIFKNAIKHIRRTGEGAVGSAIRTGAINVVAQLGTLSKQETERFEDYPLESNDYYNLCLFTSSLLLCKEPKKLIVAWDNKLKALEMTLYLIKKYCTPDSQYAGSQDAESEDPFYPDPNIQEPNSQDPFYPDPNIQEPNNEEPFYPDPNIQEPNNEEPFYPDPNIQEPKNEEPFYPDPNIQEPNSQEPVSQAQFFIDKLEKFNDNQPTYPIVMSSNIKTQLLSYTSIDMAKLQSEITKLLQIIVKYKEYVTKIKPPLI